MLLEAQYDYSYRGADGRHVSIHEGERFLLLKKTNADWWQARRIGAGLKGKPLYVPATYVIEVPITTLHSPQPGGQYAKAPSNRLLPRASFGSFTQAQAQCPGGCVGSDTMLLFSYLLYIIKNCSVKKIFLIAYLCLYLLCVQLCLWDICWSGIYSIIKIKCILCLGLQPSITYDEKSSYWNALYLSEHSVSLSQHSTQNVLPLHGGPQLQQCLQGCGVDGGISGQPLPHPAPASQRPLLHHVPLWAPHGPWGAAGNHGANAAQQELHQPPPEPVRGDRGPQRTQHARQRPLQILQPLGHGRDRPPA